MESLNRDSGWWHQCRQGAWPLILPCILLSPFLFMGLALDDYFHRAVMDDVMEPAFGPMNPITDLFAFMPDDEQATYAMRDTGLLPWWAPDGLRASFFRPITAMTHMLDVWLWPDVPALHHFHSLLWLVLGAWSVRRLYRCSGLTSGPLALAVFFFLVEDAHAFAAGWVANRNILVALFFGCLTLESFIRWRQDDGAAIWPILWMLMSLLSAEAGLCTFGYLLAWVLVYERGGRAKVQALLPFLVLIALWRLPYTALGFGTWGTGLYDDPASDPIGFTFALCQRLPILMLGLWGQFPTDVSYVLNSKLLWILTGLGVSSMILLYRVFRPLMSENAQARFWALGMIFAFIPVCATLPMNRLLFFPGLGAYALLGLLLASRPRPGRSILFWLHGPVAALLCLGGALQYQVFKEGMDLPYESLPSDLSDEDHIVYLTGSALSGGYSVIRPWVDGTTAPARVSVLAPMTQDKTLTRLDAYTFEISAAEPWFQMPIERVFRTSQLSFAKDRVFQGAGFVATITESGEKGYPKTVEYRFEKPLDDPRYRWTCFARMTISLCSMPSIGDSMVLPGLLNW